MNDQPTIGDNNPPETPFEICESKICDLYDEAKLWLDGDPVDSEKMAEGIAKLLTKIREVNGDRDKAFRIEKDPLVKASKACDDKWRELSTLADRATKACKAALQPWLVKKQKEKDEADRLAREEAERQRAEATKAIRESSPENLLEREAAEDKLKEAKKAEGKANAQARKSAGVSGGGRKISVKTSYVAVLRDPSVALEHFWPHVEIETILTVLAQREIQSGKREIPGFEVQEKKETF